MVLNYDARTLPSNLENPSPARFTLAAHDGAASSIDVNPHLKGCLVTGGTDKQVKVWNVSESEDNGKRQVSLVTSRDLGVVSLISMVFWPTPLTPFARARSSRLCGPQTIPSLLLLLDPRRSYSSGILDLISVLDKPSARS